MPLPPELNMRNSATGALIPDGRLISQKREMHDNRESLEYKNNVLIWKVPSLQHHDSIKVPDFGLRFIDRREAESFAIDGKVYCDELSKPLVANIQVNVKRSPAGGNKVFDLPKPYEE